MRKPGSTLRTTFALCSLFATLAVAGCGAFPGLCKTEQQCLGGNDKDEKACEDGFKSGANIASDYGCSDNFNKLIDCYNTTLTCTNGTPTVNCAAQLDALTSCEKASSVKMF